MSGPFPVVVAGLLLALGIPAPAAADLAAITYVSGLKSPVGLVQDPSDPTVQYVIEQAGRMIVIRSGQRQATPFLDLTTVVSSGGERGLLGLAFPRDYATSGRFHVNFTNLQGHTVVARFKRSSNPLVADPASRFDLRWGGPTGQRFIAQPFSNHNGGHLAFGPDGMLYIGMGDGGSGGDPQHNAQNPLTLLGKMLRLDVQVPDSHPEGYVVPRDNPFLDGAPVAALPEIWAFGLRNPWKFGFDDPRLGGTGALIIGDVGQGGWEEIDHEPAGAGGRNYGWRLREGAHPFNSALPPAYLPLVEPFLDYAHGGGGASVTGGFVYRGRLLGAEFYGRYFFADFVTGRVFSVFVVVDPASGEAAPVDQREHTAELGGSAVVGQISAFGVDADGELYIVNHRDGRVLLVVPPIDNISLPRRAPAPCTLNPVP